MSKGSIFLIDAKSFKKLSDAVILAKAPNVLNAWTYRAICKLCYL